ncbi:amino acid ABC transporter permease [Labrys sp. LIt4]|uniref:amino acid ABC transporter permease n=1 Tax=Labrys sp. LIt4 TaxID=2821355 RepID=UPI001AE0E888|nr:amino acid ABC transporter permease [Labrys sp. LIt4]MBP0582893.1 amino acid ABC transporter permease [Labrys sp. LIt4]
MSDATSAAGSPAFVSTTTFEPQPPPAATTGVLGWLKKSLFSSVTNSILTVLAVLLVLWVLPGVLRFMIFDAVWTGTDRNACLEANVGRHVGACWPFVETRLQYFIYGQYPVDERWRVNLTGLLAAIGIVWLLWPKIGAKGWGILYFFVAFPLLAFWLLVGGFFGLVHVPTNLWGGILVTLVIAVVGIVASLPLGVLLALGRRSRMPIARTISVMYIEFWRGVPLITVLFMANVMLPLFLPEGWRPDSLLRVLVGVALFWSAYMAEVVRGGLQAIPKGQYEGAQALGLNYSYMLIFIILPQALRLVIPSIVNTFIALFKDTTLVAIVGIFDFLKTIEASIPDPNWATPVTYYTGYAFAAIFFWICCFSMSRYSQSLERRLDTGYKR